METPILTGRARGAGYLALRWRGRQGVVRLWGLLLALLLLTFRLCEGAKFMLVVSDDDEAAGEPGEDGLPAEMVTAEGSEGSPLSGAAGSEEGAAGEQGEAGDGEGAGASGVTPWEGDVNAEAVSEEELHPGWWRREYDAAARDVKESMAKGEVEALYVLGVKKLLGGVGASRDIPRALSLFQEASGRGHTGAQSALGFMHGMGLGTNMNRVKSLLFHSFAANNGSFYSKLALAYDLIRQQEYDAAVNLYAEVAARSMAANSLPGRAPLVETVFLNDGAEESREAVRFHRGEDDETTQYIEDAAKKGNAWALRTLGQLYYWGARGLRRDHARALAYLRRAADMDDPASMLTLGEMLARGVGSAQEDPASAMQWFKKAADKGLSEAHKGIAYLYAQGKGVPRNYTKALEHFQRAARKGDPDGHYNIGRMHLKGLGVPRSPRKAFTFFSQAANGRHLGALYHLARMHHYGIGTQSNILQATLFYKAVAERGPWVAMLRWAHDCYIGRCGSSAVALSRAANPASAAVAAVTAAASGGGGEQSASSCMGTAFLLYARAAELGYEVAQSNAAWVLDRLPNSGVRTTAFPVVARFSSSSSSSPLPPPLQSPSKAAAAGTEQTSSSGGSVSSSTSGSGSGSGGGSGSGSGSGRGSGAPGGAVRGAGRGGASLSLGAACVGPSGLPCSEEERRERSVKLWRHASEQGNVQATLLVGDAYFYGRGTRKSLERAVEAYRRAKDMKSAQAMFNLGYMHERGLGLKADLHLAKRYYDEALLTNPHAMLPIRIALAALWLRTHHPDSFLVRALDKLPELGPWLSQAIRVVVQQLQDDSNKALFTLVALLSAVLLLRVRLRRQGPNHSAPPPGAAAAAATGVAGEQRGEGGPGMPAQPNFFAM